MEPEALRLLKEKEIANLLLRCIKVQEEEMQKYGKTNVDDYMGFEWWKVQAAPQTLNKLVRAGILEIGYKSNKSTCYRIRNPEQIIASIELSSNEPEVVAPTSEIPSDLFSVIVGHDDVKEIIMRSIRSNGRVHVLLHGSPASAKSLFLEELSRIPGSRFVLGSSLSKAGLLEILFEERPRFLIIDEIDKIDSEDNLSALLSLMERGKVVEAKFKRRRAIELNTTVFAACNRIEALPPELLSRFLRLRFRDYTPDEYLEVVRVVLVNRERIPMQLAIYIGEKVMKDLLSRDPRDSIKIARLLTEHTKEEVDRIVDIVRERK
ncbi:MAG: AAA family ATPase [Thaumarchaeota archaeon]|nr:AAA family ATPase [Candidatus Calditenuaceae archaeon]